MTRRSFRFELGRRRLRAVLGSCLVGVHAMTAASPARADEDSDRAAADALYQLAQQLLRDGKYADACAKLEASQTLDAGVGTLLLLGDCHEKVGKLASAWAAFHQAASLAASRDDPDRAQMADLRAAALRPRLVYVVYKVDPNNDPDGLELRRDGSLIPQASWGSSIPTDAGHYDVAATAPDRESWRTTLDVPTSREGAIVVQVPLLHPTAGEAPSTSNSGESSSTSAADHPAANGRTQKNVGVAVLAVGAASLITSGVFLGLAMDRNGQSRDSCNREQPNLCEPAGVALRGDAQNLAAIATAFGLAGVAALGAGAALYFTAPRNEAGGIAGLSLELRARF